MTERKDLQDELRGKLAKMKQNIRQLSARSDLLDGDAKTAVQTRIEGFRTEFNELVERYQGLVEADGADWEETRSEIERRLDAAAVEIQETWEQVQ